jgi:hypothetical protein
MDATNLLQSEAMSRFLGSTIHVAQHVLDFVWKPVSSCIELPRNIATHTVSTVHNNANAAIQTCFLVPMALVPMAINNLVNPIASLLKDHAFPLLGLQSTPVSAAIPGSRNTSTSTSNQNLLMQKPSSDSDNTSPPRKTQQQLNVVYIRAHDLNLAANNGCCISTTMFEPTLYTSTNSQLDPTDSIGSLDLNNNNGKNTIDWIAFSNADGAVANSLSTKALDALCRRALQYAMMDEDNSIIRWNAENGTNNRLDVIRRKPHKILSILEKEVLVWTGRLSCNISVRYCKGMMVNDVPLVRARGIICGMSPLTLVKLLLDSSQVKRYNRWSNGRVDCCVFQDLLDCDSSGDYGVGIAKIVMSESSLPFIQKKLTLISLMHARKLINETEEDEQPTYIIVSRSVHREQQPSNTTGSDDDELLLGVNLIKGVKGHFDKTELISISHMKSSIIPSFLQKKVGIGGVIEFYDRLRNLNSSR